MIKVHHLNRSRSLRILWLLEEIGADYEIVKHTRNAETNLAPDALRDLHPLGKAPMIEWDGRLIVESGAIVETICTRLAPHMIPDQSTDAYLDHLELMHFAEGSAMTPILLNLYVSHLGDAGKPLHPRIHSELENHYAYMERTLRPSGHWVLDDLSAADIMLSFPAIVLDRHDLDGKFPKVEAFVTWMKQRPAFARAVERGGI